MRFTHLVVKNPPLAIFLLAFGIRAICGFLFLGSVDLQNTLTQAGEILNKRTFYAPYFPLIVLYIWPSALLTAFTPLPLSFCFKLFPALYGAGIALLIYEILSAYRSRFAVSAGMLYALAPLSILIDSFHFQWDSLVLFFLLLSFYLRVSAEGSLANYLLAGVAFAAAFLVKPFALLFFPLLFDPLCLLRKKEGGLSIRGYVAANGTALLGVVASFACAWIFFTSLGFDIFAIWQAIREYTKWGITIFGLPFTEEFAWIGRDRTWVSWFALSVSLLYHSGVARWSEVAALIFLASIAATGLGPQHLIWPLPFLILSEKIRTAAFYGCISALFLVFYYAHPLTPYTAYENMITFAPLRTVNWLTPPGYLASRGLLPYIKHAGNYWVPISAPLSGVMVLIGMAVRSRRKEVPAVFRNDQEVSFRRAALAIGFLPLIVSGMLWCTVSKEAAANRYAQVWSKKWESYALNRSKKAPNFYVTKPKKSSALNIASLLLAGTLVWTAFACKPAEKLAFKG